VQRPASGCHRNRASSRPLSEITALIQLEDDEMGLFSKDIQNMDDLLNTVALRKGASREAAS
jgi:hypothetical protein